MNNESVFHVTGLLLLSESPLVSSYVQLRGATMQIIQELILKYGGHITTLLATDHHGPQIVYNCDINKCELWVIIDTTLNAVMLQKDALQADHALFEAGTNLTLIDSQYLVLSDERVF